MIPVLSCPSNNLCRTRSDYNFFESLQNQLSKPFFPSTTNPMTRQTAPQITPTPQNPSHPRYNHSMDAPLHQVKSKRRSRRSRDGKKHPGVVVEKRRKKKKPELISRKQESLKRKNKLCNIKELTHSSFEEEIVLSPIVAIKGLYKHPLSRQVSSVKSSQSNPCFEGLSSSPLHLNQFSDLHRSPIQPIILYKQSTKQLRDKTHVQNIQDTPYCSQCFEKSSQHKDNNNNKDKNNNHTSSYVSKGSKKESTIMKMSGGNGRSNAPVMKDPIRSEFESNSKKNEEIISKQQKMISSRSNVAGTDLLASKRHSLRGNFFADLKPSTKARSSLPTYEFVCSKQSEAFKKQIDQEFNRNYFKAICNKDDKKSLMTESALSQLAYDTSSHPSSVEAVKGSDATTSDGAKYIPMSAPHDPTQVSGGEGKLESYRSSILNNFNYELIPRSHENKLMSQSLQYTLSHLPENNLLKVDLDEARKIRFVCLLLILMPCCSS